MAHNININKFYIKYLTNLIFGIIIINNKSNTANNNDEKSRYRR